MKKNVLSFLAKKVLENFKKHDLLFEYEPILILVSGGSDSVALLFLLCEIYQGHFEKISVLHFDHQLRQNSNTDAQFVRKICQSMNLKFYLETAQNTVQNSKNLQENFRLWRRKTSEEFAQRNSSKIVLAHHLDDQNETILLKLLRGVHLSHLQGMRWKTLPYIRPLLNIPKSDLVQYLKDHHQTWVEDESNQSPKYLRNRVRHELLPLMNELANGTLNQRLKWLHQQSAQLQQDLEQFLQQKPALDAYGLLDLTNLLQLSTLQQEAILHHEFEKHGLILCSQQIAKFRNACANPHLKMKEEVAKSYFFCKQEAFAWIQTPHLTQKITLHDFVCYNDIAERWKIEIANHCHSQQAFALSVQKNSILRLRFRKNGDSFYSVEKKKLFKLNKFLYEQKIPLPQRDHLPCLCLDDKIVAVFPHFTGQDHSQKNTIQIWMTLSLVQ